MVWGGMGPVRIATLIFAAALMTGLYWILRKKTEKTQTLVLGVLSLLGITAILYNLCGGYPLQELPLHLCSFNAMVLPVAVFTRNKTLGNLLLVWSLGALSALVLPFELVNTKLLSWDFFFYFFPHVVECGIPILLFRLGLVKKDPKCILSTVGISMAVYTVTHGINLWINSLELLNRDGNRIAVNYMFTLGAGGNPLVGLFCRVIPAPYWHMYLVIPILVVYMLLAYAPQIWAFCRRREKQPVSRCP